MSNSMDELSNASGVMNIRTVASHSAVSTQHPAAVPIENYCYRFKGTYPDLNKLNLDTEIQAITPKIMDIYYLQKENQNVIWTGVWEVLADLDRIQVYLVEYEDEFSDVGDEGYHLAFGPTLDYAECLEAFEKLITQHHSVRLVFKEMTHDDYAALVDIQGLNKT